MASENESERRETVADIVAGYRADMDAVDRGDLPWPTTGVVRILLDRIEAICKREKAAIEADALAVGGVVEAAHELSKKRPKSGGELGQFGNAAAMRDALKNLADTVSSYIRLNLVQLPISLDEALRKSRAALSAPPRNCDVGTAEEQSRRMQREYCDRGECCFVSADEEYNCPLYEIGVDCRLKWAQMPYEAKGGVM